MFNLSAMLFWNCKLNTKKLYTMVSKPREHLIFIFIFFKRLSWTFFLWNRKNVRKLFFKWLWKSISSQCKMSRNFPLKGSEMLSSSKKRKKITRFEASLSVNDPKDNRAKFYSFRIRDIEKKRILKKAIIFVKYISKKYLYFSSLKGGPCIALKKILCKIKQKRAKIDFSKRKTASSSTTTTCNTFEWTKFVQPKHFQTFWQKIQILEIQV